MNRNERRQIRKYVRARDRALRDMDVDAMLALHRKHNPGARPPPDRTITLAGMHKARIQVLDMPEDLKEQSRLWLVAHGFSTGMGTSAPNA